MSSAGSTLLWRPVGPVAELQRRACQRMYSIDGKRKDLVLLYAKGVFHAMEAWCSHQGGPLFQGDIEDYKGKPHVTCPWHGYMFDAETGKNEIGLQQEMFATKTEDGTLYVQYASDVALKPYSLQT